MERSQDRVARRRKAVSAHPLDFADPHRHSRKLGRIGIELDPEHAFRSDAQEPSMKTECLGIEIGPMLYILECSSAT